MFRRLRIKYATMFGRIEHRFGRWIAFPILANIIYSLYKGYYVVLSISVFTFICWIIYLFSHKLEKKIYGKHGFR